MCLEWPLTPDSDIEQDKQYLVNRQALFALLRTLNEGVAEIYGVWAGDYEAPLIRETVALPRLGDPDFFFKERAFYSAML